MWKVLTAFLGKRVVLNSFFGVLPSQRYTLSTPLVAASQK
jgi:hypothetical protein